MTPGESTASVGTAALERLAAGISDARRAAAREAMADLVSALGSTYQVFPHGSYVTGTASGDTTPLDLVVVWDGASEPANFGEIDERIAGRLDRSDSFRGRYSEGVDHKRIRGNVEIVLTPALVQDGNRAAEFMEPLYVRPIMTDYRRYYPRTNAKLVAEHAARSTGRALAVARLLKRWVRVNGHGELANGYYLETAAIRACEGGDDLQLPELFRHAFEHLCTLDVQTQTILAMPGDKDLLVDWEWTNERYLALQQHLRAALPAVRSAAAAATEDDARTAWSDVFSPS